MSKTHMHSWVCLQQSDCDNREYAKPGQQSGQEHEQVPVQPVEFHPGQSTGGVRQRH